MARKIHFERLGKGCGICGKSYEGMLLTLDSKIVTCFSCIHALKLSGSYVPPDPTTVDIEKIRNAIADYMAAEGCSCCRDIDGWEAARKRIAELLNVPMYDDESGYDFSQFRTREAE